VDEAQTGGSVENQAGELRLRIVAQGEVIDEIEHALTSSGEGTRTVSRASASDPTELGFDVGAFVELISAVSPLFFTGPLVPSLANVFKRHKRQRVVIESPFGRVVFEPEEDLSSDQIRDKMQALVQVL
jgi:hypothetical protein